MFPDVLVPTLQNKEKAALLLKSYGKDTLSYFHLQEERQHFFSPSGKSFLSFKVLNRVAIVAADPVGLSSELPILLKAFLDYTKTWKLVPCFVGLSATYISCIQSYGLKTKKIGEEAILCTEHFQRENLKKKVKHTLRHLEKENSEVFFFTSKNLPDAIRQQLKMISQSWIQKKGGKEKGFSMTLKRLPNESDEDCLFAVAMHRDLALGYLCFVPIYKSATLSLDQARQKSDAPNGLNELLIIKSAEYFRERGIKKLSLNFAAFSQVTTPKTGIKKTVYEILGNLYKSNTLRKFNEKFLPSWEDRYIAYQSLGHMPLCLLAILRAER